MSMKGVVGVKEYFTVPSKMRKLAIITLIVGLALGTLILVITAICENNDKKSHQNNIFDNIVDSIDDYYYDSNIRKNDSSDELINSSSKRIKNTMHAMGDAYRSSYYLPFYSIGGFTIFISVGSAIALIVLAKIKENKQEQVNK